MSDLVIRQRDGWVELKLPSGPYPNFPLDELWKAIGQGDSEEARLALEGGDVFFTKPGTDGEELFAGRLSFQIVAVPDDILGETYRLWFASDGPVEVWAIDADENERLIEGQGTSRRAKPRRR